MNNKTKFTYLGVLLLIFNSCTKQPLLEDFASPIEKNEMNQLLLTPGDGSYDALGWGYNATKEFANSNSVGFQVIDIAAFQASNPTRVVEFFPNSQKYEEEYGSDAKIYAQKITNSVKADATFPFFKGTINVGFSSSLTTSGKFDGKYIWGSYNLTIKHRNIKINSEVATYSSV